MNSNSIVVLAEEQRYKGLRVGKATGRAIDIEDLARGGQ